MNTSQSLMSKKTLLLLAAFMFVFWSLFYVSGSFEYSEFDGALRLLGHHYTAQGLQQYVDFGAVYPPGPNILLGSILKVDSVVGHTVLFSTISLAIISIFLYCYYRKFGLKNSYIQLAMLLVLFSVSLLHISGEPISLLLLSLLAFLHYLWIDQEGLSKKQFCLSLVMTSSIVFFRWDTMFLYMLMLLVLNAVLRGEQKALLHAFSSVLIGFVIACSMIAFGYGFRDVFEWAVNIPISVIGPYRNLPFPAITPPRILNALVYISALVYVWYAFVMVSYKKMMTSVDKKHFMFLLGFPLVYLPYLLGRTDWMHALPFVHVLALSLVLATARIERRTLYVALAFLIFPLFRLLLPRSIQVNRSSTIIEEELASCRNMVHGIPANSVFVGRASYQRFLYNNAMLYFVRPELPPASAFISEEPGLQNSCKYGEIVAAQLKDAEKPMIAFIEMGEQVMERNKTATMASCNKIEDFLSIAEHYSIGSCSSYDKPYEIRIYP